MGIVRIEKARVPMLVAMVAAQRQLHLAWLESRSLGDGTAETMLGHAMVDSANAIDGVFHGVFNDPMLCFEEPLAIEEV